MKIRFFIILVIILLFGTVFFIRFSSSGSPKIVSEAYADQEEKKEKETSYSQEI